MTTPKQILQIEGLEAQTLLDRLNDLTKQINELNRKVSPVDRTVYLTREEVSKLLKVSLPTVWAWTKNGLLKSYRLGTKIRYVEAEVLSAAKAIGKGGRA